MAQKIQQSSAGWEGGLLWMSRADKSGSSTMTRLCGLTEATLPPQCLRKYVARERRFRDLLSGGKNKRMLHGFCRDCFPYKTTNSKG